ncbi:MAG: carboxylating nicotinate-nucleotide diphosphorylase [Chitinispirillaceae bacterium]|nr:carboxylating nicotinate-nucleotide diphosphorylase [Chitinispirillaceae bacterium]
MIIKKEELYHIIKEALREDLSERGDITSKALFSASESAKAVIKSKAKGILSGSYIIEPLFKECDERLKIEIMLEDGQALFPDTVICKIEGPIVGILAGERTALNLLQRLSGIATYTNKFVSAISHTNAKLLDTRKTTPMLRLLEKKAVYDGGGRNHRFGLYDMFLIKDTHIKHSGGAEIALKKVLDLRENSDYKNLKIEIEVQSIEEFKKILELNPDRIMLDNMSIEEMKECVNYRNSKNSKVELEASGNVTLERVKQVAETGVDFISSGAITHSAPALDIHLIITE